MWNHHGFYLLVNEWKLTEQGKSEGFDSCYRPSNLKLDSNRQFSARVTVKYDGWPWKTIGHFFYTMSSFVHHFKSIGEFKLELQSRNAQFRVEIGEILSLWPWNLMDDLGMLCAAFRSHWWIQTGVTVRKPQSGSNSVIFRALRPWNLMDDLAKH